jgi:hypothetical protein
VLRSHAASGVIVTEAGIALNVQVTTTLLSGAVALIVALLGIAGAIAAQLLATRRAYDNSIDLFKRQHAEEEMSRRLQRQEEEASRRQQRAETIRREDAHRFADQRRSTYARFLQLADEVHRARVNAGAYLDIVERDEDKKRQGQQDTDPMHQGLVKRADNSWREHNDRGDRAEDQLRGLVAEIDLLGSADVRESALELRFAVEERLGHEFAPARVAFVDAAREELAVTDD